MWLILLLLMARATGALFIFSGVSKLVTRRAFLISLRRLSFLPAWSIFLVTMTLPWLEVALGSMLVTGFFTTYAARITIALLLLFNIMTGVAIVQGLDVPCSCFGATSQATLSGKTIIRNIILALLVLPAALAGHPISLSLDAMIAGAEQRSAIDLIIIASFAGCTAGVAALIATAQKTLGELSTH